MTEVELITDGACRGNPGVGAWAALLRHGAQEKELAGAEAETTNNRMELMAVIRGLESLKRPCRVRVTTDSTYVLKGIREWMPNWKLRGWRTAAKKPVKNQDLWQHLDQALGGHEVDLHWVKGHSGHPDNERVDQLANRAIDEFLKH